MDFEKHVDDLLHKAEARFGLTDNCNDAAYILPNGEMLDFGKSGSAWKQHQKIELVYYDLEKKNEAVKSKKKNEDCNVFNSAENFFIDTGAIRMSVVIDELNLEKYDDNPITKKQWDTIDYCSYAPEIDTINMDVIKCDKEDGIKWDSVSERDIKSLKRRHDSEDFEFKDL